MTKPTICICENKDTDQLSSYISAFVFATWIEQFLYFLNPNFPASSCLLCLYRQVCVEPVCKPHCLFSHDVAHLSSIIDMIKSWNKRLETTIPLVDLEVGHPSKMQLGRP